MIKKLVLGIAICCGIGGVSGMDKDKMEEVRRRFYSASDILHRSNKLKADKYGAIMPDIAEYIKMCKNKDELLDLYCCVFSSHWLSLSSCVNKSNDVRLRDAVKTITSNMRDVIDSVLPCNKAAKILKSYEIDFSADFLLNKEQAERAKKLIWYCNVTSRSQLY